MKATRRNKLVGLAMLLGGLMLAGGPVLAATEDTPPQPPDPAVEELVPPPRPGDFPPPGEGERQGRRWEEGRGRAVREAVDKWQSMNDAERQELRSFIAEHYPDLSKMMASTEETNPALLLRRMARVLPHILHMQELKKSDPERFAAELAEQKSELELRRLVRRYRDATEEADKQALAAKIRPLVEAHFDAHQRRMADEVSKLEARLTELRKEIAQQAENRDAEVEALYQDILEGGPPEFGPRRGGPDGNENRGEGKGRGRHRGRGPRGPENPPPDDRSE